MDTAQHQPTISNLRHWNRINRIQSSDANVSKHVFETFTAVAEAVLYKYPTYADRTVICCSTQSGCPVGCRFCGAGDAFARSLNSDEIVSQVVHLLDEVEREHGVRSRDMGRLQIMFMSMGEPLLNMSALEAAIRELYFRYPQAALLISTSGPKVDYAPLRELSYAIPTIGLQFSVHEVTNEKRNALIPFKAKLTLDEIALEGRRWHSFTQRKPFFNYCAHDGNSSPAEADALRLLFDPKIWECTISVVCERDETLAAANARQHKLATDFAALMLERGFGVRVFNPAGQDDIGGGCGQLFHTQQWMQTHPWAIRDSVGAKLPVVHMPR